MAFQIKDESFALSEVSLKVWEIKVLILFYTEENKMMKWMYQFLWMDFVIPSAM